MLYQVSNDIKCNNKNTLQSGATLKRAEHSRNHVLIQHDYTASGGKEQGMVYEVLKVGEKNALSPDYLRATLGLTSNRAVQKQIEHGRRQGKVILSSTQPPGGYFRAANKYEIKRFIRTLEHRGSKTLDALNGARKLLEEFEKADKE